MPGQWSVVAYIVFFTMAIVYLVSFIKFKFYPVSFIKVEQLKNRGNNFSRRKFIKKRHEKLIGLHKKWNKYLCKDFKMRLKN